MIKNTLLKCDRIFFNRYIYRKLKSRRVHLYCTGTPKSGTSSLVTIFKNRLRVNHEPKRDQLRKLYFSIKNGDITEPELKKVIRDRERELYLELNSSCFNHIIIDQLVALYPEAKFIHPIRSPRAWLDSWINHRINHRGEKIHQRFEKYNYDICNQGRIPYAPEERILQKMNLPTIEGMLSYWRRHNLKILNTVPGDRLLVLRTKEISNSIKQIYTFAGVTDIPEYLNCHANRASKKHGILNAIDDRFINRKINKFALSKPSKATIETHSFPKKGSSLSKQI